MFSESELRYHSLARDDQEIRYEEESGAMAKHRRRELLMTLDFESEQPLYQQIYECIKAAISAGALMENDRLPSIRALAKEQGVSHTTVEQAYLQLSVEGYVDNIPRSGYRVKALDTAYLQLERTDNEQAIRAIDGERNRRAFFAENEAGAHARYDFSFANLQPDSFPVRTWRSLQNDVLYAATAPDLARYMTVSEPNALRSALAGFLKRSRGINCVPAQVFPQAGTGEALSTLLHLFDRDRDLVGTEQPGYYTVPEVAERTGFEVAALSVEGGADGFMCAVREADPRIVFTTPSHQFPTGMLMPLETRIELIQWAEEHDAYIIEDDSCNEYRYDVQPVPSLQSLDAYNRVIYLGNFSKVLSPSMRCAYFVLPPALYARYLELFNHAHPTLPWLEQEILARFISEGHLEQHIRKMTVSNRKRHDELLRCLTEQMGSMLDISGMHTGMHLFVRVNNGMGQGELLASALAQGVKVYGTDHMWIEPPTFNNGVMVGFSAIPFDDIEPGVKALRRAWTA